MRIHTFESQLTTCNTDLSTKYEATEVQDCVKLVKAISLFSVTSLDLLPRFVDLNVLVAMARDVEDVFQGVTDSGGTFQGEFDDSLDNGSGPMLI